MLSKNIQRNERRRAIAWRRSLKRFMFRTIAVLLPFIFLLLLEGVLRLFGYGHSHALFVKDPKHPGYLVMNRYASEKYFATASNATTGNYELFRQRKTADTYRIFVLGESTTVGYPYMHNGSFHRWLQYRLLQEFPSRNIEVINVALTAVNSYTVLAFGEAVLDYQPDVVLVYTGHNEYYGAQGIGSTSHIGGRPWMVKTILYLRDWKVVQLAQNTFAVLFPVKKVNTDANLMQRMAADQEIALGSDVYQSGVDQFHDNIQALCQLYSEHKVPLLISNLVSNEKDLPPFVSGTSTASATAEFNRGRVAYDSSRYDAAAYYFTKAKDLDRLRFRAPSEMNTQLASVVKHFPGVYLVDAHTFFAKHSPHGCLGNETLLEHVHPNLYGYALLSDVFYEALQKAKCLPPSEGISLSFDGLLEQMPVTRVDSLFGLYDVMLLKKGWPFLQPIPDTFKVEGTVEGKLAAALVSKRVSWNQAMDALMEHYQQVHDVIGTQRVAEAVMLEFSTDPLFYQYASQFAASAGDTAKASLYAAKAAWLKRN